jgi:hypothetical protein
MPQRYLFNQQALTLAGTTIGMALSRLNPSPLERESWKLRWMKPYLWSKAIER